MKHLTPVLCFAPPQIGSPLILPQQRLQPCSALPSRLHQESQQPSLIERRKQAGQRPSMGRAMARPATKRSRAFLSNEAVSYYHNLHAGSEIWLVGVIHDARASSRLVEKVIRKIKPKIVMVEMDAYRIRLLPPGQATKDEDGLCWWSPLQEVPDGEAAFGDHGQDKDEAKAMTATTMDEGLGTKQMAGTSFRIQRQIEKEKSAHEESKAGTCEFSTAAKEAVACGARVLLGDRDFEETKRRLAAAEMADKEDVASPGRRASGEQKMMGARIKRRGLEATTPAVWRKMRDLEKSWKPGKFAVLMTERDEVMANNLMVLGRNQHTVAIVGAHHMVGIGRILATNGWKTLRK